MRVGIYVVGIALLSGCGATQPVVSDIRHDMAKIQIERVLFGDERKRSQQIQAEADRACNIYGRIASQQISTRCIQRDPNLGLCVRDEILFACAPADGED